MGRRSEGLHIRWRGGIAYARFTHEGRDFSISTRERDPRAATAAAARVYERVVGGTRRALPVGHPSTLALEPLTVEWAADLEATLAPETAHQYELVARKWCERWATLGEVTSDAEIKSWQREMLRTTVKETARKKGSYLRQFFAWCVENELLDEAPIVPALPRRATGTRKIYRAPRVALSVAQVDRVIAALPVWSTTERRKTEQRYRVRDWARFAYETMLRPATIARLTVPEHWTRGAAKLNITPEVDKSRKGRRVALSADALAVLERCAPVAGLIFGLHEIDVYLEAAGKKAIKRRVLPYDFKHARITHMVAAGCDLVGISQLSGVDVDTLVEHYVHPDEEAGKRAIARAG